MADAGLFIGWGAPVRGREAKGLEVFNESVGAWSGYEKDGRIESFEVAILNPHGGDLAGFALLRGSEDQLNALQGSEDFQRLTTRASLIVEGLGLIQAAIGESLGTQIGLYQAAISDLA